MSMARKILTVGVPKSMLTVLQELVDQHQFKTRSAALRSILAEFVGDELAYADGLGLVDPQITVFTVNMDARLVKAMDVLTTKIYSSRSELVRVALRDYFRGRLGEDALPESPRLDDDPEPSPPPVPMILQIDEGGAMRKVPRKM